MSASTTGDESLSGSFWKRARNLIGISWGPLCCFVLMKDEDEHIEPAKEASNY